jgi:hypothetical protein
MSFCYLVTVLQKKKNEFPCSDMKFPWILFFIFYFPFPWSFNLYQLADLNVWNYIQSSSLYCRHGIAWESFVIVKFKRGERERERDYNLVV